MLSSYTLFTKQLQHFNYQLALVKLICMFSIHGSVRLSIFPIFDNTIIIYMLSQSTYSSALIMYTQCQFNIVRIPTWINFLDNQSDNHSIYFANTAPVWILNIFKKIAQWHKARYLTPISIMSFSLNNILPLQIIDQHLLISAPIFYNSSQDVRQPHT